MVKEMETVQEPQPDGYEILEKDEGNITLLIRGSINASNAASLVKDISSVLQERSGLSLTVDLEKATYLDDYGVLALAELREMTTRRDGLFRLVNPGKKVKEILSLFDLESLDVHVPSAKKRLPNIFVRMGEARSEERRGGKEC